MKAAAVMHHVDTPEQNQRDSGNAVCAHVPAFAADQAAFNGGSGLRPSHCQCALERVIATARLLHANRISTTHDGSYGVRAPVELIL